MSDETLLPCKCGAMPQVELSDIGYYYVYCAECGWIVACSETKSTDEAIRIWNDSWSNASTDALAAKDALHEAVVVALDHLTAGLGKREDVILELREAHLRAADVDHANRSLSPKEVRIKELEAALAAARREGGRR